MGSKFETIVFRIAGFNICVVLPYPKEKILFSKTFQNFISSTAKKPDIIIRVLYDKIPEVKLLEKDFLAGVDKWWSLYQSNGNKVFVLYPVKQKKRTFSIAYKKVLDFNGRGSIIKLKRTHDFESINAILPLPYRIAIFKSNFKEGVIYINSSNLSLLPNPLEYPFLDLLLAELLSLKGGIKFHGCGIVDNDQCYLFLGLPKKGKSTMAKLWQKEAIILSDDRVPVQKLDDSFLAFATPGYGINPGYTAKGVPVSKIFFIHHGTKNKVFRMNGFQALSAFLSSSPLVTWDNSILKQAIKFFMQMVGIVPCYSLYFVPNEDVLDLIRRA